MPYFIQTIINSTYYIFGIVSSFGAYLLQPIIANQEKFALDIVLPYADDIHTIVNLPLGNLFNEFVDKIGNLLPLDLSGIPMIVVLAFALFIFGIVISLLKRLIGLITSIT